MISPNERLPKAVTREDKALQTNEGDNAQYIFHAMAIDKLGERPVDLTKPRAVRIRITDYFAICAGNDMKPNLAGLSLAFGVSRSTFRRWIDGGSKYIPEESRKVLEKAWLFLNAQIEDYMYAGKINTVNGIFLMKNNFDYEDNKTLTVVPQNPLGAEASPEELRRRYATVIEVEPEKPAESEDE